MLPPLPDTLLRLAARAALATPLARVLGRPRIARDPALDPQVAAVLELERRLKYPALDTMEPGRARQYAAESLGLLDVDPVGMDRVVDVELPGRHGVISARIYEPFERGPHWIVYLHGGGGVVGSIAAADATSRLVAAQTGCAVASIDYRLGPEHPHPAAIEDACDAFVAVVARAEAGARIAVAGDSFGGYLAAHVDRQMRLGAGRVPDLQVLIYPLVDQTMSSPSIVRYADGFLLTRSMIEYFRRHQLGAHEDRRAISPIAWSTDALRGAAPAIVVTAGFDPLVDEGDAYATQLAAAGVEVRHRRHASLVHGFLSLAGAVRAARAATDEICADIRAMLS